MTQIISNNVKKNLFDLDYNKNLQNFNTCVILLFTYFLGIIAGFITGEIDYKNYNPILILILISSLILITLTFLMINFTNKMKVIYKKISLLDL